MVTKIAHERIKRAASKKSVVRRVPRSGDGRQPAPFKRVTRRQIRAVVERIVAAVDPDKVILFGSYAYGKPTIDSDVDFLVVLDTAEGLTQRTSRVLRAVDKVKRFPMDILVRTPREIESRQEIGDFFVQEILERGQVLYERHPA